MCVVGRDNRKSEWGSFCLSSSKGKVKADTTDLASWATWVKALCGFGQGQACLCLEVDMNQVT